MMPPGRRVRSAGVALLAALIASVGSGSVAWADTYQLNDPIAQRSAGGDVDNGYRGPVFYVSKWGTSVDTYVCPKVPNGPVFSNWVVVGEERDSADRWFESTSSLYAKDFTNSMSVKVTNWSLGTRVSLRLAASCTDGATQFPYDPNYCGRPRPGKRCSYPRGEYLPWWLGNFQLGPPGEARYADLIRRAFCWNSTYPGCEAPSDAARASAAAASPGTHGDGARFALHDGSDTMSLTFNQSSLTHPPAVHLNDPAGCTAQHLGGSVESGSGEFRLVLRCHGLKPGAAARVSTGKAVERSFRLHQGSGTIHVRLSKPPGTVQPLGALVYGPGNKSCGNVRDRLRMHSRTFNLRIAAHCGRAAGNSTAHLYVGGLIG